MVTQEDVELAYQEAMMNMARLNRTGTGEPPCRPLSSALPQLAAFEFSISVFVLQVYLEIVILWWSVLVLCGLQNIHKFNGPVNMSQLAVFRPQSEGVFILLLFFYRFVS